MTSHLDSEKLTKIISGLCFAGAVIVGHTFAGDAAAETVGGMELGEQNMQLVEATCRAQVER